jgi:hypothetical protein
VFLESCSSSDNCLIVHFMLLPPAYIVTSYAEYEKIQ